MCVYVCACVRACMCVCECVCVKEGGGESYSVQHSMCIPPLRHFPCCMNKESESLFVKDLGICSSKIMVWFCSYKTTF